MHGIEPLLRALGLPPTRILPGSCELLNVVPKRVMAISSQTGHQHDFGVGTRRRLGQDVQGLLVGPSCRPTRGESFLLGFVDHHGICHFDHPALDALNVVPGAADEHEHEDIDHASNGDFALPDAHRFDQDQVVPGGFAQLNGFGS